MCWFLIPLEKHRLAEPLSGFESGDLSTSLATVP